MVVWFCAKQSPQEPREWHYFFIGCSTVRHVISRRVLWDDDRFASYRRFYNVLAKFEKGQLIQHETFHRFHEDWRKRASAGYVIFDPRRSLTAINVSNPIHVATKPSDALLDVWRTTAPVERKAAPFLARKRMRRREVRFPIRSSWSRAPAR